MITSWGMSHETLSRRSSILATRASVTLPLFGQQVSRFSYELPESMFVSACTDKAFTIVVTPGTLVRVSKSK